MKYTFMHKNIKVLDLELDKNNKISTIYDLYDISHLPVGIGMINDFVNKTKLNEWWTGRSIPLTRDGIRQVLQKLNVDTSLELLSKSYGLSLSDQYWIKPVCSNLTWDEINFFNNSYSDDLGNLLIGIDNEINNVNLLSPNNTSDGNLRKSWKIINGKRCLLKSGTGVLQQEVFNECLASKIMDLLNIDHVRYDLIWLDGNPYSVCEDFINENEDLISAFRLLNSEKKSNNINEYNHLLNLAKKNNIKNYQESIDKMMVLDYLILNEDRHYNNFGFVRDAITLEYKGMAPIYDNGTSLGYNVMKLNEKYNPNWKPFMSGNITSQLELVSSFSWLDLSKIDNIDEIVRDIYPDTLEYSKRVEEIIAVIKYRISKIKEYIYKEKYEIVEFGLYLRELRKKYKMSLQDLSKELGCGVPFLSLIENGKKLVPQEYVEKITKIMNLNDEERTKLKNSVDYSNKKVQIDLDGLSEEQKKVSIYFARTISGASPDMLEEIQRILEEKVGK